MNCIELLVDGISGLLATSSEMTDSVTDMALQAEDKLEKLRQRATCPICKEFYDTPRRLNNCSHVFCLQCLRTHLRLNVGVNFPKCPMCRKPMSNPLSEIHKYETARAEEDIVEFVKQYETCDICENKENPNVKCLECNWYICKNCIPSHGKLKPSHQTELITATKNNKRTRTKNTCEKHPEQTIYLFCLVCQRQLCGHCERFSHSKCRLIGNDLLIKRMYGVGFLRYYVEMSEERTLEFRNGTSSKIVYIADFVDAAAAWLQNVQAEVSLCLNVFDVYKTQLLNIFDEVKTSRSPSLRARIAMNLDEINSVIESGIEINQRISKLLENVYDYEIATSVMDIERKAFHIFKIRSETALELLPMKLIIEDIFSSATILRQASKSCFYECDGKYAGMFNVAYFDPIEKLPSVIEFQDEKALNLDKTEIDVQPYSDIIYLFTSTENEDKTGPHYTLPQYETSYQIRLSESLTLRDNKLYSNNLLSRYLPNVEMRYSTVNKIKSGYLTTRYNGSHPFEFNIHVLNVPKKEKMNQNPLITFTFVQGRDRYFSMMRQKKRILTNFTNVLATPIVFDSQGKRSTLSSRDSCIACFLGNRNMESGLETVFTFFGGTIDHTYCVCINTGKTSFKASKTLDLYTKKNSCHCQSIKNETDMFNLLAQHHEECFTLSYRSKLTKPILEKHFILLPEQRCRIFGDESPTEAVGTIPVTGLNVSLLCSLKQGLYYAKFETEHEFLSIERLTFTSKGVNTEVVYKLKASDINAAVSKLKPLTMVEDRKENFVVVCAMEDANDTFVMIWPDNSDSGKVEIFQIEDTPPNLPGASVIDLEMDQDGNIVYILENREGKTYSGITRYIMP